MTKNIVTVEVTPELAQKWLDTSKGNPRWTDINKRIDKRYVNLMARDIISGNWYSAGDPIKFREDGSLVDGHHRLSAVVMAGKSVFMDVRYGITPEEELHIDDSRKRSDAQRLGANKVAVAVANIHIAMADNKMITARMLTIKEKEIVISKLDNIQDAIRISCTGTTSAILRKAGSVHGIMCAMDSGVPVLVLEEFAKVVNTGFMESKLGTSAIVLRKMLSSNIFNRTIRDSVSLSAITQDAIYDYYNGINRRNSYQMKHSGRYFESNRRKKVAGYEE